MSAIARFVIEELARTEPGQAVAHQRFLSDELDAHVVVHLTSCPAQNVRKIASALAVTVEMLHPVLRRLKRAGVVIAIKKLGYLHMWSAA